MKSWGIRGVARALAQPVTYLGIATLVFLYGALAYLLAADRRSAEVEAMSCGDNLVRVLDQSYSRVFQSVDATLLFLRKSHQENPSTFDISACVRQTSVQNELTFEFTIVDRNGIIVGSTYSKGLLGAGRNDREYFRVQRDSVADKLYISEPLTTRLIGRSAVIMSRRIVASDGAFAGIVFALLDPVQLAKLASPLNLGHGGSGCLARPRRCRARTRPQRRSRLECSWTEISSGRRCPGTGGTGQIGAILERAEHARQRPAAGFVPGARTVSADRHRRNFRSRSVPARE